MSQIQKQRTANRFCGKLCNSLVIIYDGSFHNQNKKDSSSWQWQLTHQNLINFQYLSAKACKSTKSNTPPWVFFRFLKFHKWYQIAQRISHNKRRKCKMFRAYAVCLYFFSPYYWNTHVLLKVDSSVPSYHIGTEENEKKQMYKDIWINKQNLWI